MGDFSGASIAAFSCHVTIILYTRLVIVEHIKSVMEFNSLFLNVKSGSIGVNYRVSTMKEDVNETMQRCKFDI